MARTDSMIWFLFGFAQLIIADVFSDAAMLTIMEHFFNISGGGSLIIGLYVLLFMAKHSQDFADVYSKFEKSEVIRKPDGNLEFVDGDSAVIKGASVVLPAILTIIAAITWLATV